MAVAAPPEPYDRLVSRFGIMFFDDPPAAFTNLVRWLKPGGFFAFAAWGPPAENAWVKTAREVVARIVEIPPPDPDAPGPFRYADAARFVALLTRAGFTEVNAEPWRGTLPVGGGLPPAEAAHFALSSFATFAELLAKAGEAATAEARRALAARFSEEQHDGVVRMGACVNIVTGVRA